MLRWEDDQYYDLPQDIADMHGWEELVQRTATIYHSLSPEEQKGCMIYGGSYGHAGAINYFREKYQLPRAYSMNGSYAFWTPDVVAFDKQIMIDDVKQEASQWFATMELVDSIRDENAREVGYIYWRVHPKIDLEQAWTDFVQERKTELGINPSPDE